MLSADAAQQHVWTAPAWLVLTVAAIAYAWWARYRWWPRKVAATAQQQEDEARPDQWYVTRGIAALEDLFPPGTEVDHVDLRGRLAAQPGWTAYRVDRTIALLDEEGLIHHRPGEDGSMHVALTTIGRTRIGLPPTAPARAAVSDSATEVPTANVGAMSVHGRHITVNVDNRSDLSSRVQISDVAVDGAVLLSLADALREDARRDNDVATATAARKAATDAEAAARSGDASMRWSTFKAIADTIAPYYATTATIVTSILNAGKK